MSSKYACANLLRQFRQSYDDWLTAYQQYQKEEKEYQREKSSAADTRHRYTFAETQYIEENGFPYSCLDNKTTLNCHTFATKEHKKCKCQQLYGGRSHLHAPCNADHWVGGGPLTREYCEKHGYLSNGDLPERMEKKLNSDKSAHQQPQRAPPTEPTLVLPTITCSECTEEFQQLANDFSYENLSRVSACIERLPSDSAKRRTATETAHVTQPNAVHAKRLASKGKSENSVRPTEPQPNTGSSLSASSISTPPTTSAATRQKKTSDVRHEDRARTHGGSVSHESETIQGKDSSVISFFKSKWQLIVISFLTCIILCYGMQRFVGDDKTEKVIPYRLGAPNSGLLNNLRTKFVSAQTRAYV